MIPRFAFFGVAFLGALLGSEGAFAASAKGPRLLAVSGKAELRVARDKAFRPAVTSLPLVEKASFRTGADGRMKIRVSAGLEIELFPESEVSFPGISWESGDVPVVEIRQGEVRWKESADKASKIQTALYELNPPAGDFVFLMDAKTAVAGVKVLDGELSFKALNGENAVSVGAGQKVRFTGVIEEGEIAYDILLRGRKIPRGVLGKAEPMTPSEREPFREADRKIREQRSKAEAAERERRARERRAGVICKAPAGRFNECAWVCENNPKGSSHCRTDREKVTCYRVRCNANGIWADRLDLPAEEGRRRCQAATLVETCDY